MLTAEDSGHQLAHKVRLAVTSLAAHHVQFAQVGERDAAAFQRIAWRAVGLGEVEEVGIDVLFEPAGIFKKIRDGLEVWACRFQLL